MILLFITFIRSFTHHRKILQLKTCQLRELAVLIHHAVLLGNIDIYYRIIWQVIKIRKIGLQSISNTYHR